MKWIVNARMRRIALVEEVPCTSRYAGAMNGHFGVLRSYKVGNAVHRLYDSQVFDSEVKALEHLLEQLDVRLYDMREKFEKLRDEYEVLETVLAKVKAAQ